MALLEVKDLKVSYHTYAGEVQAVRGISFDVERGEVLAIIGESGCGKSVTARAVMQLVQKPQGEIKKGSRIVYNGKNILTLNKKELRKYRGGECAIIFQDALVALNPIMKVGRQIEETLLLHRKINKKEVKGEVVRLFELVGIPSPESRVHQYPFQFSGGMRQRVMIAMAIAGNPKILIADEPTTALDVTIQAQILELILDLKSKLNTAVILITHDFGVVAGTADKIAVMYAGIIVEYGGCEDVFEEPGHPYTLALLNAVPKLEWKSKQILHTIQGSPPDLTAVPKGCPFAKRCEHCMNICLSELPENRMINDGHFVSCHRYDPENENSAAEL